MAAEAVLPSSLQPNSLRPTLDSYAVELQALEDYRNFSATTIQRYYRGWIYRIRRKRQDDAKLQQQAAAAAAARAQQHLYQAARIIQDAWRGFNNRRIYSYYRDLIGFKEAGDPRQMLRCINAREAALIDPAAGLHVRFRLGGSSFPPLVFYKIYTHRPVTDIGAFGPRNYVAEQEGQLPTAAAVRNHKPDQSARATCSTDSNSMARKQQHRQHDEEFVLPAKLREYIKPDGTLGYRSSKGWYHREDRNGWRPVAERLLLDQEHQAALPPPPAAAQHSSNSRQHRPWRRRRLHVHGMAAATDNVCMQGLSPQQQQQLVLQQQQQNQLDCSSSEGGSDDEGGGGGSSSGRSSPVYHYSPIVRREERARQLKQRRRQWLLKIYRAGMRSSAAGDSTGYGSQASLQDSGSSAAAAADGTRQSSVDKASMHRRRSMTEEERILQVLEIRLLTSGTGGGSSSSGMAAANPDADDWDVDALVELGLDAGILAWSQKLDFDSYQQHWSSTAVTLGSSVLVPESEKLLLQQLQQDMPA